MMGSSSSLRQRLLRGGKSYGPLILSDSPVIAELLGGIGYDHVVVDTEHSPSNLQSTQRLLQAIDAASPRSNQKRRTEAIVRLDSSYDAVSMKKVLDSIRLPGGVLVPMVEDAETAKKVVEATRYPHQQQIGKGSSSSSTSDGNGDGIRGCAVPFVRASGWGTLTNDEYIQQCNDDLLVIVQVESPAGVEAIPDIANIDGIDMIFLGPFDLSASIGKMGEFTNPEVQSLISRAERAVLDCSPNCLLGGFRTPGVPLNKLFNDIGYSLVCGSIDLGLMRDAARLDAQAGKEAMMMDDDNNDDERSSLS